MTSSPYRYVIELYRSDNSPIGRAPVCMDWEPAEEWARFLAIRRGHAGPADISHAVSIQPVWQTGIGEPHVQGLRVSIPREGLGHFSTDLPLTHFKWRAGEVAAVFVDRGKLSDGESYKYVVAAFPHDEEQPRNKDSAAFDAEETPASVPITEPDAGRMFEDLLVISSSAGLLDDVDMPAFIPQWILVETAQLSRSAGSVETGGILIGHLHRASPSELFAEVTAQIPARHVIAETSKLTFTAETWTDVRAALNLRNRGEVMLGWWHSHVARELCKQCPEERQRVCQFSKDFFSAHDRALHRAIFPRAYSIALVANDAAFGDVTHSMFGWRHGLLELRGFHVMVAPEATHPSSGAETQLKGDHVSYAHERI